MLLEPTGAVRGLCVDSETVWTHLEATHERTCRATADKDRIFFLPKMIIQVFIRTKRDLLQLLWAGCGSRQKQTLRSAPPSRYRQTGLYSIKKENVKVTATILSLVLHLYSRITSFICFALPMLFIN